MGGRGGPRGGDSCYKACLRACPGSSIPREPGRARWHPRGAGRAPKDSLMCAARGALRHAAPLPLRRSPLPQQHKARDDPPAHVLRWPSAGTMLAPAHRGRTRAEGRRGAALALAPHRDRRRPFHRGATGAPDKKHERGRARARAHVGTLSPACPRRYLRVQERADIPGECARVNMQEYVLLKR